jgi:hypothetical protein
MSTVSGLRRLVTRSDRRGTRCVTRLVLGSDCARIAMFGHTGNTVREIVYEPHHKGIRPFRLGALSKMLGLVELTSGDHVTLTFGCGKFAGGALSGTVGSHINSVQVEPHVLNHAVT